MGGKDSRLLEDIEDENSTLTTNITTTLSIDSKENKKLMSQGYSHYFIVNAFLLIIYNLIAWGLSYLVYLFKKTLLTDFYGTFG